MKKATLSLFVALLCSTLVAFTAQQATAATIVDFSFDGVANDTGSAWQEMSNGVGTGTVDITDGTTSGVSTAARGFNSTSPTDLSALSSFTVQIDVASAALTGGASNGTFFGITSGPNAGLETGAALYNNSGTPGNPSVGIQVAGTRGGPNVDLALDQVDGNGTFTEISLLPTQTSADDGFTLFLTFSDNGTGDAGIAVSSIGLDANISYAGALSGITYASLADDVHGNISTQGGSVDVDRYRIYEGGPITIPEPASVALLGLGALGLVIRRRS